MAGFNISDNLIVKNGNIGVGTSDPSQRLHVNGNIYTTGNLEVRKNNPVIILGDSSASSNTDQVAYISFQAPNEEAWVGWGSSGNDYFTVHNGVGRVRLSSSSGAYVNDSVIWHAGNDGSGSGLDADTVDGLNASTCFRKDTVNTVVGTTTFNTLDSTFLRTGGNGSSDTTLWRCNGNAATNNSGNYGFTVKYMGTRSGNNNTFSIFSDNQSASSQIEAFQIYQDGTLRNAGNKIWTEGNDGPGSTLHADLLDGQHGSYYLDYNNFTNTPSGGGGGGDDGPAFTATSHVTGTGPPISLSANTWTKVNFNNEIADTDNCYSSSRFTPDVAGWYFMSASVQLTGSNTTQSYVIVDIRKNGSQYAGAQTSPWTEGRTTANTTTALIYFNGSSDYAEVYIRSGQSNSISITFNNRFSGALVRKQ